MADVEIRPAGDAALLIEVDDPLAWFTALDAERAAGRLPVTDIVPGARTILLDGVVGPASLADRLRSWNFPSEAVARADVLDIPVSFDGEDLPGVAEHLGLAVDEVVATLVETRFSVAFAGFAPGFAYLSGLPWNVPRLSTPRTKVPAGSVALAAEYAGIYPASSPGGWQLVGRTETVLFDPLRDPPALLTPGLTVRFTRE